MILNQVSALVWACSQTPVLGLGLGVDFTFAEDNDNKNDKNDNIPHLNFVKGTVLGDKDQGVGIRDKGFRPKWSLTLKTKSCNCNFVW